MSSIIPRSKAKGTDIFGARNCYYIIRSDLGCYMQTRDLHKGSDISIFSLHPACQNGDHYIGDWEGYFHIIKGNSCRRVRDLSTDNDAKVYSLHPNCQGGDHYCRTHGYFTIIFQEKGTYRLTTDMNLNSDAKEQTLVPKYRDGLYYWHQQFDEAIAENVRSEIERSVFALCGCPFFCFLKSASEWGVEYYRAIDLKKNTHSSVCSVHPDVLNFLPGGLSVTKGPATGKWENIKTIINDSTTPVTWQKKITKKVGFNKEKMTQITHNWNIAASVSGESGTLAALIVKWQFSFSAEYGGSHVSTENESWNEATEEEESLTFELKPKQSLYLWQYNLGLGQEPVLFCRDLMITNEPNPPTQVPLPPAHP